jgi:sortase A
VIRHFSSASSDRDHTTHELLQDLLLSQVPTASETLQPVALRSTNAQRRLALRPFLLRTWVDHALHHTERLLTVALLICVAYWLLDGYGRDWLHQLQQKPTPGAVPALPAPLSEPHASVTLPPSAPAVLARALRATQVPALPFITPAMAQPPAASDYIAPQIVAVADVPADLRPQRLRVPSIDVDTSVVEVFVQDGAWQVADYAAGYHHGTALPGKTGNTVMAGHAGIRGSVFRDLGKVQIGDRILVEAGGWQYGYHVRAVNQVGPMQVEVMAPTPTAVLTLITCTAWDTKRLIVVADLVESRPLT